MTTQMYRIMTDDVAGLYVAKKSYGDSWIKRGGVGAFMMLARKWDRIETQMEKYPDGNILNAVIEDTRAEGIIDDIRDLRRYLILVSCVKENKRVQKSHYIDHISDVLAVDYKALGILSKYSTWKDLWSRLEFCVQKFQWDIIEAPVDSEIRYLRTQLYLLEEKFNELGINPEHRDNATNHTTT